MNQRLKELYDAADYCASSLMAGGATEEQIQERAREVFAQLIVREVPNLLTDTDLSVIAASLDRGSNLYDFRLALESMLKKRSKKLNFTIKKSL